MKRFFLLGVELCVSAALVFAGGKPQSGGSTAGKSGPTLIISMLGYDDTQVATWENTLKENREIAREKGTALVNNGLTGEGYYRIKNRQDAEKMFPDVKWEWVDWGWAETLDTKQRSMIAAGTPPTMLAGEGFFPAYAESGLLQEVPAYVLEGLNKNLIYYGMNGKAYGVAMKTSPFMLFYNKGLMRKAGLDPNKPPATWDEWKAMAKQITDAGKGQFWGGGIPSFPHLGGGLRATPFFRQNGTDFAINGRINLNDPKLQATLQFIREMNAFFPPGLGNGTDEDPLWKAFHEDQTIAFAINGSWQEVNCRSWGMDYGVAPLPIPAGGQAGNCLVGTVYCGVPAGIPQAETDIFWKFYKEICLGENNIIYLQYENLMIPTQKYLDDQRYYQGEGKESLRVSAYEMGASSFGGVAVFLKNHADVWDILNSQVLARVTMSNDPISRICSEAQSKIETLTR
ncbi:MAG: extracellular solute-binding protein [Treponema sp.]|jgi:multiple sugar transport system substrate-binding protein|nr:extracellular solute-binding protein [Treponema sp.]